MAILVVARTSASLRATQRANRVTLAPGHDLVGLQLSLFGGGLFRLERDMPHPVLLLYASETCPHCHAEVARLAGLLRAEPAIAEGLDVVVVTPGPLPTRDPATDTSFLPAGFRHVRAFDPLGAAAVTLRVRVVPLSIVIGRNGRVRDSHIGQTDRSELRTRLLLAISGPDDTREQP